MKAKMLITFLGFFWCLFVTHAQVNLSDYNVSFDGTGATTNHIGFQQAIDDAHTQNISVLVPPGQIILSDGLIVPSNMVINGSGIAATKIIFDASFSGSVFEGTNFSINSMEIFNTRNINLSRAIKCNGGALNLSYLQISFDWDVAVECTNCNTLNISNSKLLGRTTNDSAIKVNGTSSNINIIDIHTQNFINGILINGDANGVLIKSVAAINNQNGIIFNPTNFSENITIDGGDITGCERGSILLHQVKNVLVKNIYSVTRRWIDANAMLGSINVSGNQTDKVIFNSINVSCHSQLGIIKDKVGIKIEAGNNIEIHSLVTTQNAKPSVYVSSDATNVLINGVSTDLGATKYVLENPSNTTIIRYNRF